MRIASASVALGLAVMILSVSVVLGFKHSIQDRVAAYASHITVQNFMTAQGMEDNPLTLSPGLIHNIRAVSQVSHVQKYVLKQGLFKTETDFLAVTLKGIAGDYDTLPLHESLVEGKIPQFSSRATQGEAVLSKTMAEKLNLKAGDRVTAYFHGGDNLRARPFTVAAIYETNITPIDDNIAFTSIYTTARLNQWDTCQVSGLEVTLQDERRINETASALMQAAPTHLDAAGFAFTTQTVQDRFPQIYAWLSLLDLNVWIILFLMVLVAAVTMVSTLFIVMIERTGTIGTLKAFGARTSTIRHTFLWFASFIIVKGMVWGNVIALVLIAAQYCTGIVKLDPATYYVRSVPVEINVPLMLALNAATLAVNVFALIAPTFIISRIRPSKTMRYE